MTMLYGTAEWLDTYGSIGRNKCWRCMIFNVSPRWFVRHSLPYPW